MNLPLYRLESEPSLALEGNRGLWYSRFFNQYAGDDWAIPDDGKRRWVSENAKWAGAPEALQIHALRQRALVNALRGRGAVFATDWHFATGLGLPHPVENGLAWHHTLGVPYLAGSGVKGLIRAWMEVWEEKKQLSEDWFGTTERAGRFLFFDAVPIEPVQLAADVMTPHMAKWYELGGKIADWEREPDKIPADWHAPVPVPFLVVKQAKLLFGIAPRRSEFAGELDQVFEALQRALDWLGAGAKTAAGYGRMVEDPGAGAQLRKEAEKAAAQAAEAALLPHERDFRDLKRRFEEDSRANRLKPSGQVVGDLNKLLEQASDWPIEYRKMLADLAEDIFGHSGIGWGNSAKKRERKAKIQALRGS